MKNYSVTIKLDSITYEIEAENEEKAIESAQELFADETIYDIIKWAGYEVTPLCEICENNPIRTPESKWCDDCRDDVKESDR